MKNGTFGLSDKGIKKRWSRHSRFFFWRDQEWVIIDDMLKRKEGIKVDELRNAGRWRNAEHFWELCWLIEATKNYRSNRENGSDVDNPKHLLPLDGSFRWVNPDEENDAQLRYDEGSGDKAWMEEKDRNYLARLRKGESFSLLNALFLLFPRSVNMQNIVELQKTGCANVTASDYASLVNVSDNAGFIAELIQNKYEKNVHIYVETLKQVWANAPLCLDIILYLNEEDIFSPPIKNSMRCTIL